MVDWNTVPVVATPAATPTPTQASPSPVAPPTAYQPNLNPAAPAPVPAVARPTTPITASQPPQPPVPVIPQHTQHQAPVVPQAMQVSQTFAPPATTPPLAISPVNSRLKPPAAEFVPRTTHDVAVTVPAPASQPLSTPMDGADSSEVNEFEVLWRNPLDNHDFVWWKK